MQLVKGPQSQWTATATDRLCSSSRAGEGTRQMPRDMHCPPCPARVAIYRGAAIPTLPTQTDIRHMGAWTRVVEIGMVNGPALGLGCRRLSGKTQSILIPTLIPILISILISILLGACRPRGASSQLHSAAHRTFMRYLPEPPGMIPTFSTRHSRYCYQAQRVWSHDPSRPNTSSKPILAVLAELAHATGFLPCACGLCSGQAPNCGL
jgi:hypothetical protein